MQMGWGNNPIWSTILLSLFSVGVFVNALSHEEIIRSVEALESQLRAHRDTLHAKFDEPEPDEDDPELSGETVAHILGGYPAAEKVAAKHGYELVGPVRGSPDHYLFKEPEEPQGAIGKRALGPVKINKRALLERHRRLSSASEVLWSEPQKVKLRVKRDMVDKPMPHPEMVMNDELWSKQWYLHDTRTHEKLPKLDLHVIGAWRMNITGKGVSVTILDDGLQWDHEDIKQNYDPKASYDLNDNDTDPMPAMNEYNKHGTRCAGEVGMVANNKLCGVGVAYNAKVGGIRMLDGKITDRLEAEALQYNIDHVDVYSASWGPNDDGKTVEGPGTLAEKALYNGIYNGRGGKGVIYVWASGNGGSYQDNCDCDGYTDSIFTLSVSSASQKGSFPWYGERCSSTLTSTYSSGSYTDQKITTIDLSYPGRPKQECTTEHTGTSASAPLAAGIVALALEAKFGLHVSNRFGFGLMNAEEFVKAAKTFKSVGDQRICTTTFPKFTAKSFKSGEPGVVRFSTDACKGQENEVNFLEHVQLVTDIDYTRRGNLMIYLTSPSGTRTRLLSPRRRDNSRAGFRKWPFMSVHTWGEDPKGWWQLEVYDKDSQSGVDFGSVTNITLITYGTTQKPPHYGDGRQYNYLYNEVQDRDVDDHEMDEEDPSEERKRALADLALAMAKRTAETVEKSEALDKREADDQIDLVNRSLDRMQNLLRYQRELRSHEAEAVAHHEHHFISK